MFGLLLSVIGLTPSAFASPVSIGLPQVEGTDRVALHDGLLARFDAESGNAECLTGLILTLKKNWGIFTPAERLRMTAVLAPFKADLLDPLPPSMVPVAAASAAPPSNFASDSCFGQQEENQVFGDHFVVEWNTGSTSQSAAEAFLADLEFAYTAEVDELGWNPPATDGRYLMLVMVSDQNMGGAYTTVDSCGGVYAPYIVVGKDVVASGSWTHEMAAHELVHALQFNTSFAPEEWWWEATATYVQGVVRSSTNWADYVSGYSQQPYIAIGASSQSDQDVFYHMYGMMIFALYLDNWQGGGDVVRQTWENAETVRGQYEYGAEDMVEDLGLDWRSVYIDFITRNAAMEYEDSSVLPSIDLEARVDALPASGEGEGGSRPQGYGQNYIRIEAGAGEGDLVVNFSGDADVDWAVVLAERSGNTVLRSVSSIVEGGSGQGTQLTQLTMDSIGAEDVYLIVSPLTASETKRDYSWDASIVASEPIDTGNGTGDSGGNGNGNGINVGNGAEKGGCGCSAAPLAGGSTFGALGVFGVLISALLRRRRSLS